MPKLNLKKNLPIVLISFLLTGVFLGFLPQAQALQIKDYPSFLSIRAGMTLTELVGVIFVFLLMVAGLAAFIMIVWGGFKYLTSVGDPSKMGDAKEQIFGAVLGLIIIFSSWMILNTINPQLTVLKEPSVADVNPATPLEPPVAVGHCVTGAIYAVELYSGKNYTGERRCYNSGMVEKTFNKKIYSIKINSSSVKLYDEPDFSGKNICFQGSVPNLNDCILAGAHDCAPLHAGWEKPKSLQAGVSCSSPGATLETNGQPPAGEHCLIGPLIEIPVCIYQ